MRASHNLSSVAVSCDEPNLVSGAGLLPAAVLAQKIGLAELVEHRVSLARHGANGGTKALTVVGSMPLGGDSVADTALLQAGATGELFDQLRAPSTIGSWLRAFKTPCTSPSSRKSQTGKDRWPGQQSVSTSGGCGRG
jgi:hypothetical protein